MSAQSAIQWIDALREGDNEAANCLWKCYFKRVINITQQQLARAPRRWDDEEDVALIAFASLCRDVAAGRFMQLKDQNDLRCLLLALVTQIAVNQIRRQTAQKRAGAQSHETLNDRTQTRSYPKKLVATGRIAARSRSTWSRRSRRSPCGNKSAAGCQGCSAMMCRGKWRCITRSVTPTPKLHRGFTFPSARWNEN